MMVSRVRRRYAASRNSHLASRRISDPESRLPCSAIYDRVCSMQHVPEAVAGAVLHAPTPVARLYKKRRSCHSSFAVAATIALNIGT